MPAKATKTCPICCADVHSLMVSPATCTNGHGPDQRACTECWEAYLSKEVEEKAPGDIRCMFCPNTPGTNNVISEEVMKKLAYVATFDRYKEKLKQLKENDSYQCQARCWASKRDTNERNSLSVLQPHNRETDGRIFTCKFCFFATCTDCDYPSHPNESCTAYHDRVLRTPHHLAAEAATAASHKTCPNCHTLWHNEKGCGYTVCTNCKFRFCGRCLIPWVGDGSAYLGGKRAHGEGCLYRTRDAESKHGLKRRFELDGGTRERLREREERREAKARGKGKGEVVGGARVGVKGKELEAQGVEGDRKAGEKRKRVWEGEEVVGERASKKQKTRGAWFVPLH